MAKRIQPPTVAEAAAAYDQVEITWHHADDWCRALERAFAAVLDEHTTVGRHLSNAFELMARGEDPAEDVDALWVEEARLRAQMRAVMGCRHAAAKRRNAVWEQLKQAERAERRAARRAA